MRRNAVVVLGLLALMLMSAPDTRAQKKKLAQTGMKFLSFSVDPRAAGMGDATTAMEGGSEQLFYNPAGMAWQRSFMSLSLGATEWIADIKFNAGSVAFQPAGGRLGVFGFSFVFVDFGELQETIRFDNEQGFLDLGTFKPAAWTVGFGYARALTDRFSVGAQVKYANEDLGSSVDEVTGEGEYSRSKNQVSVYAFDFGVFYKTGFRSLNFAVSARNFSKELVYEEDSFQIPLTLKIGVSMDVMDFSAAGSETHSLLVSIDAENPRDFSEQIKLGTEYTFLKTFAVRAGYAFPTDEQRISLGFGIRQVVGSIGFAADYSYTEFGIFSGVHRLALRFSL
ncbi:MAG: hypothetical protein BMS9Abin05_0798 [Rhodothermia bacterium]|nr:MAG: hypothetical protein BMS9Abin05_0798 [Rhodothermia bacterium]